MDQTALHWLWAGWGRARGLDGAAGETRSDIGCATDGRFGCRAECVNRGVNTGIRGVCANSMSELQPLDTQGTLCSNAAHYCEQKW